MKEAFALLVVIALILGIGIVFDLIIFKMSGSCHDAFSWLKTRSVGLYDKITSRDLKRFKEARIRRMEATLKDPTLSEDERTQICRDIEHCKLCKFCDSGRSSELEI